MRILAVLTVATTLVAVEGSRLMISPFDTEYRDTPPFFHESPRRTTYLRPFGASSKFSAFDGDEEEAIFSDGPPSAPFSSKYRGERIYFGPSPPPSVFFSHKLQPYSESAPPKLRKEYSDKYIGPPPPMSSPSQWHKQLDKQPPKPDATRSTTVMMMMSTAAMEQPKQPLSFGGHANHLAFGDHSLGFASVDAVTSADIDPLAIAEAMSTTRAAAVPSVSASDVQVSQQQAATSPTPTTSAGGSSTTTMTEQPTSAASVKMLSSANPAKSSEASKSSMFKDAQSTTATPTTAGIATTKVATTLITTKSSLDPAKIAQTARVPEMMIPDPPRMFHDSGIIQEPPPAAHGQLPIETSNRPGQQQYYAPNTKENILVYEARANYPSLQSDYQIQQQPHHHQHLLQLQQQNDNNIAPVRFTLPTVPITSTLSAAAPSTNFQRIDFTGSPAALSLGSSNYVPAGHNQVDATHFSNYQQPANEAAGAPSYHFAQNNEQSRPTAQPTAGVPLGSFYVLPNNEQSRQQMQINPSPAGGGLQLSNFDGIEFFSASGNSDSTRPAVLGIDRVGLNLQNHYQSPVPTYARIGAGPW